jgi:hypothetical protein
MTPIAWCLNWPYSGEAAKRRTTSRAGSRGENRRSGAAAQHAELDSSMGNADIFAENSPKKHISLKLNIRIIRSNMDPVKILLGGIEYQHWMDLPDSWMVCIFLTTSEQLWC